MADTPIHGPNTERPAPNLMHAGFALIMQQRRAGLITEADMQMALTALFNIPNTNPTVGMAPDGVDPGKGPVYGPLGGPRISGRAVGWNHGWAVVREV